MDLAGAGDPLRAEAEAAEADAALAALRARDLAGVLAELADRHGELEVRWAWGGPSGGGLRGPVVEVGPDVVALVVDGRRADVALRHVTAVAAPPEARASRPVRRGSSLLGRLRGLDVEVHAVELWLADGERLVGDLVACARDHVLVDGGGPHVVVPLAAIVVVLAAPDVA